MAPTNRVSISPNEIILPLSFQSQSSHPYEYHGNNQNNRRRISASHTSSVNCNCLARFVGGVSLVTLLAAAIIIPLKISLSYAATATSSPTITVVTLNLLSTETETSTTTSETSSSSTTTSTSTSTTTTTDIPCSPTCSTQQTCVLGRCVGIGYLSCTLTWSRTGDGDIVLKTPNNKLIYYFNPGPTSATDYGQLDVDATSGTGPENIFWSSTGSAPPNGTYYVCLSQYSFSPAAIPTDPITATVIVVRSTSSTIILTKTFTAYNYNYVTCHSSSGSFIGSFTYP